MREKPAKKDESSHEEPKHEEEQQQKPVPILAIDPPIPSFTNQEQKPQVDFPAVKFPMNDEINNMNNREHNPLFFQVDEPLQQEQQQVE